MYSTNSSIILHSDPSRTEYFEELLVGYDEFIPFIDYDKIREYEVIEI